jgi:tetratricopeptide (TPR) repeat protein
MHAMSRVESQKLYLPEDRTKEEKMDRTMKLLLIGALALTMGACQAPPVDEAPATEAASTEVVMKIPMTTDSEEAKASMMAGFEASDLGRFEDARNAFQAAVEADPGFALGHLAVASAANSYSEFVESLDKAVENAEGASEAEQAWIATFQKGFANDFEGQLAEATKIVELVPDSPRGWLQVAGSHAALGNYAEQRATAERVIEMAPGFLPAYAQLANSYLFNEPRDFGKAEAYVQNMLDLAPDEQNSHDLMGDVHRAQGDLEAAHADYTRAAELAPDDGSPLQQRGHVNSFLGNYEEARADYDAAMALVAPQVAANFRMWRTLVSVYEGNPEGAIAEFEEGIAGIDEMGLDDPFSPKIQYLNNVIAIANHYGMTDVAEAAIERNQEFRMARLEATGAEEDRSSQEATIAWAQGMLAASKGDVASAKAKAEEFMTLVADDADPRRNEPAHQILGRAALATGDYEAAIEHYEQTDPADVYAKYHLGLACEGAGDVERAKAIYSDIANYNFNNVGYALIRSEAVAKASG